MKTILHKSFARNVSSLLLSAAALFFTLPPAQAIVDVNLQMQLGNPTGATADPANHNHYLLQRATETIDYSDDAGQPNWASWDLTDSDTGTVPRSDAWALDTSLPSTFWAGSTSTFGTYNGITWARGHMCPSADRTDTLPHNEEVFIMSNLIPQAPDNNSGFWETFETYCRNMLSTQELLIICGPANFSANKPFDSSHVRLASNIWKIVVCAPLGSSNALYRITNSTPASIDVIALYSPNTNGVSTSWPDYRTSTKQIQAVTGYNFFSALPNNLAWVLRSKNGQAAAAPGSIGFSPSSGATGTVVTVTGWNLDSTTNVTFNSTVASYTITATNQLTAIVPAGATTHPITVRTLGGTATSASNFTVTDATSPDLTLTKTHTGNFNQGDTGDTYTITVTNVGTAASSSTVTVVDTLPAGLTATAISGTSWTATLNTLTCTRSDALAAGAAYPPITVTVNVAGSAAASVTNTATVSGGGETNTGNDTALDPTTINAATLSVSPSGGLTSSGTVGGPFSPGSQIYTLNSTGGASVNWTASKTASWLTLSATSGTLAGGASTNITVSINSGANSLTASSYSDTVSFTNATNGAGNATRAVSLTVNPSPAQLAVSPSSGFNPAGTQGGAFSPGSQAYTLSNTGGVSLNWTASKTANWLTLSATSGALAGGASTNITVSINSGANSLAAGSYSDTVGFTNTTNHAGDDSRAVSLIVHSLDSSLPVIFGVQSLSVTQMKAIIQWTTDILSGSRVLYGTSPSSMTNLMSIAGNATNHVITIPALTPGTVYYYEVLSGLSTNDNGGSHYTFTTGTPCVCY